MYAYNTSSTNPSLRSDWFARVCLAAYVSGNRWTSTVLRSATIWRASMNQSVIFMRYIVSTVVHVKMATRFRRRCLCLECKQRLGQVGGCE